MSGAHENMLHVFFVTLVAFSENDFIHRAHGKSPRIFAIGFSFGVFRVFRGLSLSGLVPAKHAK